MDICKLLPELKTQIRTIPEGKEIRIQWAFIVIVPKHQPDEIVKRRILNHLYEHIGKITVIAQSIRDLTTP